MRAGIAIVAYVAGIASIYAVKSRRGQRVLFWLFTADIRRARG